MSSKAIERILLVHNSDEGQELFAIALQELCGFEVTTVDVDDCAAFIALSRRPEAVVLNSGVCEAYKRLVSDIDNHPLFQSLPVILVAGEADQSSSPLAPVLGQVRRSTNYVEMALEVRELLRSDPKR